MITALDEHRAELADLLHRMSAAAGTAMRAATVALRDGRERLAEQVLRDDVLIDDMRAEVERRTALAMVRHTPVAGDLRTVVGAIRSAGDIERMGDLAKHVARAAQRRGGPAMPAEALAIFERMGSLGADMADQLAEVARTRNVVLAMDLERADDAVDDLLRDVFELVLDPEWAHGVGPAVDVTLLARFYERYADHAVSAANQVVYMVTGRTVAQVRADLDEGVGLQLP